MEGVFNSGVYKSFHSVLICQKFHPQQDSKRARGREGEREGEIQSGRRITTTSLNNQVTMATRLSLQSEEVEKEKKGFS